VLLRQAGALRRASHEVMLESENVSFLREAAAMLR
jgi:hypothetical protein